MKKLTAEDNGLYQLTLQRSTELTVLPRPSCSGETPTSTPRTKGPLRSGQALGFARGDIKRPWVAKNLSLKRKGDVISSDSEKSHHVLHSSDDSTEEPLPTGRMEICQSDKSGKC